MEKKIVGLTLIMLMLVGSLLTFSGCSFLFNKAKPEAIQEPIIERNYVDLYKDYMDNFFNSKEIMAMDDFEGIFINIEEFDNPILISYFDQSYEGKFIKIFYIENEAVKETKKYKYDEVKYLYNISEDKAEMFLYTNFNDIENYMSVNDIFTQSETNIRGVSERNLNVDYVKIEGNIEYTIVTKNNYKTDLDKVDQVYKNRNLDFINSEVTTIKENLVYAKDDEIVYKDYHIKYGTYSYGNYSFTLNKDKTFYYDTSNIGNKLHIEGTCKYGYKTIRCDGKQGFADAIEIVGDKEIRPVLDRKVYLNQIFTYQGE